MRGLLGYYALCLGQPYMDFHFTILYISGLKDIIHNAYNPPIHTVEINQVIDCKEWLLTGMEKVWGNHSRPLHFLFKKVDGETVMFYK
jgi:hypothetical protein